MGIEIIIALQVFSIIGAYIIGRFDGEQHGIAWCSNLWRTSMDKMLADLKKEAEDAAE